MTEQETIQKINLLSEFEAQRDLLELDKRKLLEETEVPKEVQDIVDAGWERENQVEENLRRDATFSNESIQAKLDVIVIPEEIKAALAEIDRQRAEIMDYKKREDELLLQNISEQKQRIRSEVEAQTKDIYAQLAQRKAEIEAEFAGKKEAVDKNIARLEAEIKAEVAKIGFTVKGTGYMAEYGKPRKTWIPKRLDKYVETHPDIKDCFTLGEPTVSLRKI